MRTSLPLKQKQPKSSFLLKRKYFYLLIISNLFLFTEIKSQVSTYYTFSQSSGTYVAPTSGFIDTTGLASNTPASIFIQAWDDKTAIFRLPFAFTYNGVLYAAGTGRIGLDTDAWFTFSNGNPTMTGQLTGGSWVGFSDHTGVYLSGSANNNGFAGFNCDLNNQNFSNFTGTRTNGSANITGCSSTANLRIGTRLSGNGIVNGTIVVGISGTTVTMSAPANANSSANITPSSSIIAFVSGTAPNRQFVIQWTQAKRYLESGTEDINFQMILNEAGGTANLQTIQVMYGSCATNIGNLDVQVGLRGASSADFNARTSTTAWASTTASTANTNTVRFGNAKVPASGLTFTWSPCTTAPGNPGAISGSNSVCQSSSGTYTLASVPTATTYTWTYTGTGVTFTSPTSTPSLNVTFGAGATSGTLSVTAGNICGTNATPSTLAITVNPLPTATISYPAASPVYCTNAAGTVAVTQTGTGGGTYAAAPAGLSINSSTGAITPSLSTAGTYTVTYSFTSGGCPNSTTASVTIKDIPSASALATPASVCSGSNSQLNAYGGATTSYTVNSIPYVKLAPSGTATNIFTTLTDEAVSGAISIPFTFRYYGQNITQLFAYSNGFVQLGTSSASTSTYAQTIPNATNPNNLIALAWSDLVVDPSSYTTANVRYFVNGVTPNRVFVVEYTDLSFYDFLGNYGNVSGQVRLYETNNHIEVAIGAVDDLGSGDIKTLGIENAGGTAALTPAGRNAAAWNVYAEAWGFYPSAGPVTYAWSPSTYLSNPAIANPVATAVGATTNYTVTITDNTIGCSATATTTVNVSSLGGVYTVGAAGNFTTLTAAVNAWNTQCITAPVTFSLIDATYSTNESFPITINSNAYASSSKTLTIKPATGVTSTITGNNGVAILKLNGADYITVDGSNAVGGITQNLSIINTNTSANTTNIIWLNSKNASDAATNNTIKNCIITGNSPTTTFTSLLSSGSSVGAVAEAANVNNSYLNNVFTKANTAIAVVGASGNETGTIISGNTIGSATAASKMGWSGIELYQQSGAQVINNKIAGITNASTRTTAGIAVYGTNLNSVIGGNKISDIKQTNALGFGASGIYLGSSSTNANILVYNNFIFDIAAYGSTTFSYDDNGYGLVLQTGGGYNIYHNTIALNTNPIAGSPGGHRSACVIVNSALTTASSVNMRNNLFSNTQTTGNANSRYVIISLAANSVYSNINYNGYYNSGSQNLLNKGSNAATYNTLPTIQANIGGNVNSVIGNTVATSPLFVSSTDFHVQSVAANSIVSNLGTPITGITGITGITSITSDYDTTTRNGYTPDLGADEWLMPNTGSWVGKTSIDWLVNTNWETNKIPDATTDVTITGGYTFMPTVVTTQPVRALILNAPVPANTPILTLNAGTLQVYGTITRTGGNIAGSNGTVEMNGMAAQTIPASLFVNNNLKNLVIGNNSAAGVTLGGTLDIYRSLTFSGSGLKLTTGNFLTFKSTATETAWLGNVTGKTIIGSATVERFIPTGINHAKSWQLLAVPVRGTQSVKAAWQENNNPLVAGTAGYGTTISSEKAGATGRGYDFYTPTGASMKTYDPASNAFKGIDNGSTATSALSIANQRGYMVFVRGDRSVQTSSAPANVTTLRTFGPLYTATAGELPPVTTVLANKFETIGNPYPSAIDFTAITKAAGVDNVFYVWDPMLAGSYSLGGYQTISSTNGYLPTPGSVNYPPATAVTSIQSGQAFFVHGTAGGNVSFTEAAKLSGSDLVTRTAGRLDRQFFRMNIYIPSMSAFGAADGNVVAFDDDYSNEFDANDALKLINTGENISILSNEKTLAVEARKMVVETDTIFYNFANLRQQPYQLRFGPQAMGASGLTAYLFDKYLHTTTNISLSDTTVVDFTVNGEAGSSAVDRFYVVFKKLNIVPLSITRIAANRNADKKINVTWTVDNEINVARYEVERSADGRNFQKIGNELPRSNNGRSENYASLDQYPLEGTNYYRIKAWETSGAINYSSIVKVSAISVPASISIYPNPVVDKLLNVQFAGQVKGIYKLDLSNKLGQSVYKNSISVNNDNSNESLKLDGSLPAGTYQLRIAGPDGKVIVEQVFIQ